MLVLTGANNRTANWVIDAGGTRQVWRCRNGHTHDPATECHAQEGYIMCQCEHYPCDAHEDGDYFICVACGRGSSRGYCDLVHDETEFKERN